MYAVVAAGCLLLFAASGRAGRVGPDTPGAADSLVLRHMDRRGTKRGKSSYLGYIGFTNL